MSELKNQLPPVLSISALQQRSGDSRSTIYRKIKDGRITAVKDGRRVKIITDSWLEHISNLPRVPVKASTESR